MVTTERLGPLVESLRKQIHQTRRPSTARPGLLAKECASVLPCRRTREVGV